jgi:3-oxoacyl-[acyl-carrier protein] reductase
VTEVDFDMALQRLIRPVFLTVRAFVPSLRARGGGAILLVAARPGPARQARDVWTMAALGWLEGATRALAAEVAQDGLRINALLPAIDDTPTLPKFLGARAASAPPPPLGRYPAQADAGAAAVFLTSDAGATLTGQVFHLDAGRHL